MKIAQIGCNGHYWAALEYLEGDARHRLAAFAPGHPDEPQVERFIEIYRERLGFDVYGNWEQMLDSVRPDLVIVATCFDLNAAIARACLERGMHVYAEKPSALDLAQLESLRRAYLAGSSHYTSMLEMRAVPAYRAAKAAVQAGAIGRVLMATAQKSYKLGDRPAFYRKRATYGGSLGWIGVHMVDLIRYITRCELLDISARHAAVDNGGHGEMENIGVMQFRLSGGGLGQIHVDYLRPKSSATHGDDRLRIAGTGGIVEVIGDKAFLFDACGERELPLEAAPNAFGLFIDRVEGRPSDCAGAQDSFAAARAVILATISADDA